MKIFRAYMAAVAGLCLALFSGCGSDSPDSQPKDDYNREAMLVHYADNLIIPGYQALKAETETMHHAIDEFTANPSATTLASAREAYQMAYTTWQHVSPYNFGPADEQLLTSHLNIFPVKPAKIESNIASGTYNFTLSSNFNAQGFPALDYLLNGKPTDAEIIALYTTDANAANRKKYIGDAAHLMLEKVNTTYTAWRNGYTKTFKEATGTAVGSGVGNLVNQLNANIDLVKRYKVGTPNGQFTAGTSLPEEMEAYYSNISLELLKANIKAQKTMFAGGSGPGLDDYLNHINAKYTGDLLGNDYKGKPLAEAIAYQFDKVIAATEAVPAPLSEAVKSNQQAATKVYDEFQKLIVLTKTDMPSALGVSISYSDNDGD